MKVYKTVLAPNAPWPTSAMSETEKSLKETFKGLRKARSKPSDTDARFEAWLKKIQGGGKK